MKMSTSFAALAVAALALAGCESTTQISQQASPDGNLMAYNAIATDGQGGVTQALLIQDSRNGAWVMQIGIDRFSLGRELITSLLSPGVLAAVISGRAAIQIAQDGACDGQCGGTIIYNDGTAVAGAVSNSESEANSDSEASVEMEGGSGYSLISASNFDPTLLPRAQGVPLVQSVHPELTAAQAEQFYDITIDLRAQLAAM